MNRHEGHDGGKSRGPESARIFEGSSDTLLHNSSVVVEGNKIFGLGNSARVTSGTEVIDLGDATLSLGFIDAHTNLTWDMTNLTKFFVDGFRLQWFWDSLMVRPR